MTSRKETNNDLTRITDASANVTQSATIKRPSTRKGVGETFDRSTADELRRHASRRVWPDATALEAD